VARYLGLICDLDGTVYLSGQPLPGAVEALRRLRAAGVRVLFVSNNPLSSPQSYAERLTGMGIPTTADEVLTSGAVTADWIRGHAPGASVLVLGETNLFEELSAAGAKLVHKAEQAEVVIASFDRTFTYDKWVEAFRAIRSGARFIATNPDPTCPVDGGEIPDCGGIIAALEASTGRTVEAVMGKPSPAMLAAALDRLGLAAKDVLIAGDRLGTDIALGTAGGVDSALVLTGVTSRAMAEAAPEKPTYVLESLGELPGIVLG
jgi:HAD superfamily hydrolase (TIGR01457 family)